ncbi:ATP-binding cassette domain-containing protein [Geoalkalibacter halelectricus]|uniref:ATP-binding cassette domain-containing protein n=1 Tax=Geoalkalibacter halelectricus TaxID=2847045 RepID=UPI00266F3FE7|nr:ATP-binding cassette domain-containing protein [Geoalkalibacter halelectricus]MDO3377797.1 ATP-binding cassette domain-containing protein [Geoalkalibacter halelectricus]
MASQSLLRVSGVGVRLGAREVLKDIDLEVQADEILTIVGPNGAGKTTLLRIALGLLRPDRGEVWRCPGLRLGYVPQRLNLDETFPLSVRGFLKLAPAGGLDPLNELEGAGLRHLADRPLQKLSGGELQRVLLVRAQLNRPQLLVLDEPTQGIDVHGQQDFYQYLGSLRRRLGCAILLVSHDLHLVMGATDRVVCLNRHICCTGTPEAIARNSAFIELFGARADSLAIYSHDRQHRHRQEKTP